MFNFEKAIKHIYDIGKQIYFCNKSKANQLKIKI